MRVRQYIPLLLTGLLLASAAAHHDHDHGRDNDHAHASDHSEEHGHHHDHAEKARLLIAAAHEPVLYMIDAASGALLGTFTVPGLTTQLVAAASGQYAVAIHPDVNRVSIIHSGQYYEDHGDHGHLIERVPYVLATMNLGQQPSRAWADGDQVRVWLEGESTIAVLDEQLFGLSLNFTYIDGEPPASAEPDREHLELLPDNAALPLNGDPAAVTLLMLEGNFGEDH